MSSPLPSLSDAIQTASRVKSGQALVAFFAGSAVALAGALAFSPLPDPIRYGLVIVLIVFFILLAAISPFLLKIIPASDQIQTQLIQRGFMEIDRNIVSLADLGDLTTPSGEHRIEPHDDENQ